MNARRNAIRDSRNGFLLSFDLSLFASGDIPLWTFRFFPRPDLLQRKEGHLSSKRIRLRLQLQFSFIDTIQAIFEEGMSHITGRHVQMFRQSQNVFPYFQWHVIYRYER